MADLAATLVDAKNKAANLKAALDSMAAGTTPTFNRIEVEVGDMAAGTGETLYNIVTDFNQKLSGNIFDGVWKLYRG
ncbi:MAG TPA: hypothetical protein DCQ84_09605 [Candidatus Competibacteraceae bacterium]|nr:hypothetical protein [Candidatus Competibacteraceae bacterium]